VNRLLITRLMLLRARQAVELKASFERSDLCKAIAKEIHIKQYEEVEDELSVALQPMFVKQIRSISTELAKLDVPTEKHASHNQMTHGRGGSPGRAPKFDKVRHEAARQVYRKAKGTDPDNNREMLEPDRESGKDDDKSLAPVSDQAQDLIAQTFDPQEWQEELVDRTLPVLAKKMLEAAHAQLRAMGFDRKAVRAWRGKTTTATEWLDRHSGDEVELAKLLADEGVDIELITELPHWMQKEIATQLSDTFQQSYWLDIHNTTMGDAELFLQQGLDQGWSIDKIAKAMREHFIDPDDPEGTAAYARRRALNIARTEAGHALNGARKMSMDALMNELAGQVPMRPTWLSVLGSTTRDSHAALDGVPADENGLWDLAGYKVPWPGHTKLPAGLRCSCQCSIVMEFGMRKEDATRLINEYDQFREEYGLAKGISPCGCGVKHLPGQHNQQTHGTGGGGARGDVPLAPPGYTKISDKFEIYAKFSDTNKHHQKLVAGTMDRLVETYGMPAKSVIITEQTNGATASAGADSLIPVSDELAGRLVEAGVPKKHLHGFKGETYYNSPETQHITIRTGESDRKDSFGSRIDTFDRNRSVWSVSTKRHAAEDTIAHEFGHLLTFGRARKRAGSGEDDWVAAREMRKNMRTKADKESARKISNYAYTDRGEMLAEAFVKFDGGNREPWLIKLVKEEVFP